MDTSAWNIPPRTAGLTRLDHEQHPARRIGPPDYVAALVSFLASQEAGWIRGVDVVIDGGMARRMIYLGERVIRRSVELLTGSGEAADAMAVLHSDPSRAGRSLEILRSSGIL